MAGNKENLKKGKKFSSEHQPAKNGRKKSILNQMLADYKLSSGSLISKEDRYGLANSLMDMTVEELEEVIANPKIPAFILTAAKAIRNGAGSGTMGAIDNLWDRRFGKPKQDITLEGGDTPFVTKIEIEYVKPNKRDHGPDSST